ncbi:histone deacetylase family protein [Solilutibacter silvestris]|uniref:histone deacetylase family protein n=1 Tax=Solilutibacter silvestris TaxID=1645665 RepID=UPI000CA0898D|nr:histone deacetylase family protein [Lysobacter silvestris]
MRIYTHSACLDHDTGPGHAEHAGRLRAVRDALHASGLPLDWQDAPPATRGELLRVHHASLVDRVLAGPAGSEIEWLDSDTALSAGGPEAALRAAGAALAAVDWVMAGDDRRAFCAVRPPGHHAETDVAMGFCLLNNIAVAAAHALANGVERIAIADFDVHHGNGTQAIFERDPRVLFVDSHQSPLYPDSGHADETGVGNIVNATYPPLTGSRAIRALWEDRLIPRIDAFKPQLLLISAGFDAHREDPLAQGMLEAADFAWITQRLIEVAERHARGRIVSTLEGGYALPALAESASAHVAALAGQRG